MLERCRVLVDVPTMIRVWVLAQQDWRRWVMQRLIQAGGRNSAIPQLSGGILATLLLSQSLTGPLAHQEWIEQAVNNRYEGNTIRASSML